MKRKFRRQRVNWLVFIKEVQRVLCAVRNSRHASVLHTRPNAVCQLKLKLHRLFSSAERPDLLCGPTIPPFSGYRKFFSSARRPEHESNHSILSSADIKNEWSHTPSWRGQVQLHICHAASHERQPKLTSYRPARTDIFTVGSGRAMGRGAFCSQRYVRAQADTSKHVRDFQIQIHAFRHPLGTLPTACVPSTVLETLSLFAKGNCRTNTELKH